METLNLEHLLKLRLELEKDWPNNSPAGNCLSTSTILKNKFGFRRVLGEFSAPIGPSWTIHHVWNYDPKSKVYVDLTADQFFGITDKVLISKPKNNFYYKKHLIRSYMEYFK